MGQTFLDAFAVLGFIAYFALSFFLVIAGAVGMAHGDYVTGSGAAALGIFLFGVGFVVCTVFEGGE